MNKFVMLVFAGILLGGCASYSATSGRVVIKDDTGVVDIRIEDRDRAIIDEYYKGYSKKHKKGLPPGLAKRNGALPPGLAKRDKLPPGLQWDPLPHELEKRLSRLPDGYVRIRVGQDIVLMDHRTRVVFDVIYDIAR